MALPTELRAGALASLLETDPAAKIRMVAELAELHRQDQARIDNAADLEPDGAIPGRPEKPELVPPRLVGRARWRPPRDARC